MNTNQIATGSEVASKLGKHQKRILDFAAKYPGPHSMTKNLSDPAHDALNRLCARGLIVKLQVGSTIMFEQPAA